MIKGIKEYNLGEADRERVLLQHQHGNKQQ